MYQKAANVITLLLGAFLACALIWALAGCSASGTVDGNVPDANGTYVVSMEDGEFTIDPYTPSPLPTVTFSATPEPSSTPTPTPTPTIVPGAVNIAPGGNIQAAIDSLGKDGGTIVYNARPTWLSQAHERLDRAVYAAYGWPYPLSDDELLERLLEMNRARYLGVVRR